MSSTDLCLCRLAGVSRSRIGILVLLAALHATSGVDRRKSSSLKGALGAKQWPTPTGARALDSGPNPQETPGQPASPTTLGTCIRNTGRACSGVLDEGNLREWASQCTGGGTINSNHAGSCNAWATDEFPANVCVCPPGQCADIDSHCHHAEYKVVPHVFQITTKEWGAASFLYSDGTGQVKIGNPPDASMARWRMAVTPQGAKQLWVEAFPNQLLQDYESCISRIDPTFQEPYMDCSFAIGMVAQPQADETGWHVEFKEESGQVDPVTGQDMGFFSLRSVRTRNTLYMHPTTYQALACEQGARNCPGPWGTLQFNPPLRMVPQFVIDDPPPTSIQLIIYATGIVLSIFIALALCITHHRLDSKETHLDDHFEMGLIGICCYQFRLAFKDMSAHHR
eukprot:gnl/TRDRNA2_/TRDRNA2_85351_c0_seq1.p1 gnl/TRDRNA2_/TRDRNA2_85351_c0~~gnl/TRDRNA2_/TRDRNA2_85351_c0_seq1.p1  ORF type:complete len:396 (+),score=40.90 gnl/TRDRNA2_/TRDRNA2_85351_c0_seq1:146-1333(+)